ncbi:MAG TPA: oxidoreductase [Acidimicrobiia bacterium]|nr:oxidoreductase [Acidimicrobiia bacterium]
MAWSVSDIPDLTGKVAVVTGANSGLGLETARALAKAGATVVMTARDADKGNAARDEILAAHGRARLEVEDMDLTSLDSVRSAATRVVDRHAAVDILVNNAGVMATPERRTEDGFELQFGVNHLGHWVLTARLLPRLLHADAARVVTVTSTAHHFGSRIDPDNPNLEGRYDPWRGYNRSKLANYHFALGLDREFRRHGATAQSLVAHPGLVRTHLQVRTVEQGATGWSGRFWRWMAHRTGMDPARGALPQLRAATDPTARGGQMYAPRFVNSGPPVRRPILRRLGLERSIEALWDVSEDLTGVTFEFPG